MSCEDVMREARVPVLASRHASTGSQMPTEVVVAISPGAGRTVGCASSIGATTINETVSSVELVTLMVTSVASEAVMVNVFNAPSSEVMSLPVTSTEQALQFQERRASSPVFKDMRCS